MPNKDLLLSSYDYDLPPNLIASRPAPGRINSKLLVYNSQSNEVLHTTFSEIHNFLPRDSMLVLNQSKVFPCRLLGNKKTGAKVEIFFLTAHENEDGLFRVLIKSSGKKRIGDIYLFVAGLELELVASEDAHFYVRANFENLVDYLNTHAKIPIPPYIRNGESDEQDKTDYQTVFAKDIGSVAAPTAGLHFTDEMFETLKSKNVDNAKVTLHVGLGTFAPVKTDSIVDHKMHNESYFVENDQWHKIINAKKRIAVGTTSLRTLESIWKRGPEEFKTDHLYDTSIFLHPGVDVLSIDALITNFHLPKSTLLMLVSSLIGREKTLELYKIAVENEYRFFSYGDAMLILR